MCKSFERKKPNQKKKSLPGRLLHKLILCKKSHTVCLPYSELFPWVASFRGSTGCKKIHAIFHTLALSTLAQIWTGDITMVMGGSLRDWTSTKCGGLPDSVPQLGYTTGQKANWIHNLSSPPASNFRFSLKASNFKVSFYGAHSLQQRERSKSGAIIMAEKLVSVQVTGNNRCIVPWRWTLATLSMTSSGPWRLINTALYYKPCKSLVDSGKIYLLDNRLIPYSGKFSRGRNFRDF